MTQVATRLTLREGLRMLEGDGPVLRTARAVSELMRRHDVRAAVVGGVAVSLHGHLRTTADVNVLVQGPLESAAAALLRGGYRPDKARRAFTASGGAVPVRLVTLEQAGGSPLRLTTIEGVQTIGLADLIAMKLRSGTTNVLGSQGLADVIGLIRVRRLRSDHAARLPAALRREFRALCRAIERDG